MAPQVDIVAADFPRDREMIVALFREYAAELGIDLAFQDFEAELASLPGKYAPPKGRLYLAWVEGTAAGCIALRPLATDICEMKRLYIRPKYRSLGLAKRLAALLITEATQAGYQAMRLDTLSTMDAAIGLYTQLGFEDIVPYYHNPTPGTRFMELKLATANCEIG